MNIISSSARLLAAVAVLVLGCAGCSLVAASGEHTAGVRALNAGNTDEAIAHLEESVHKDPYLAGHQNTLAAAYYIKGQYQRGWPHVRSAILLQPDDRLVQNNFRAYYKKFVDLGLIKNGASRATILQNLGRPDGKSTQYKAEFWKYGTVVLYFQADRLANAEEFLAR